MKCQLCTDNTPATVRICLQISKYRMDEDSDECEWEGADAYDVGEPLMLCNRHWHDDELDITPNGLVPR